jgi:hypothetical protein
MEKQIKLINEANLQKGVISKEKLSKELDIQEKVMKEILEKQTEERTKTLLTNPSAPALDVTAHSAGEGINKVKKTVKQLFILYLTNQFVARAVNVRADTIISRGYELIEGDAKGIKACSELIENSGGPNLIWQLGVNTYIAGDGFLEKVYNINKNKILKLKHVHPLTLSYKTDDKTGRIIVGKDKTPVGYVQYYIDKYGIEAVKDVPKDIISHFKFNSLGDEFTGISLFQSGYGTTVRLMNMEYSAAEAAIKTANPMWVVTCNTKSPHQIAQWSLILGRITGKDQLFIPEGMVLDMKSPGAQNFSDYAEYFLNAVVAATGVPKGVLLGGTSSTGNRAQEVVLSRHYYSGIRRDQRYVEDFFNNIFKEYGEIAGFKPPKLIFEDVAEDAEAIGQNAKDLFLANIIDREEAREMIGLTTIGRNKVNKPGQTVNKALKQSDKKTFFPAEPGSPAGSQKNVKKKQKRSPFSEVKKTTK